jgi:hypothetical protein
MQSLAKIWYEDPNKSKLYWPVIVQILKYHLGSIGIGAVQSIIVEIALYAVDIISLNGRI